MLYDRGDQSMGLDVDTTFDARVTARRFSMGTEPTSQ
jgi:hypothetical protein